MMAYVAYRWGGKSVWMPIDAARAIAERDRSKTYRKRIVAYIVRCSLRTQ